MSIRPRDRGLVDSDQLRFRHRFLVLACGFLEENRVLVEFLYSSGPAFIHQRQVRGLIIDAPVESLPRGNAETLIEIILYGIGSHHHVTRLEDLLKM
jgi:hypothetical protein